MKLRFLVVFALAVLVGGCATSYQDRSGSLTGGYSVRHLEGDIQRVAFNGNGHTTKETVQTYWLYKCTELTLEKGFDGFEILSNITLTHTQSVEDFFSGESLFQKAQVYYIPMPMDSTSHPELMADIRLLKKPFEVNPPKVFDAKSLQDVLAKYVVTEKKCDKGNVCEHVHKYLHPEGKFKTEL